MFPAPSQLCFCSVSCVLAPGSTNIPSLSSSPRPRSFPDCTQPLTELCSLSWPLLLPSQSQLSRAVPRETALCWDVQSRDELAWRRGTVGMTREFLLSVSGSPGCLSSVLQVEPGAQCPHRCPHPLWHNQENALRDKGLREKDRAFLTDKDHAAFLLTVVFWLPGMPRAGLERYPKGLQPCQAFDVGGQGINVDFLNQQRARI